MLFHCYSQYQPDDAEVARRQGFAQATWGSLPWTEIPVRDQDMTRLFQDEGKRLPYLRDILDAACVGKNPTDIIVHTNSDIHVRSDAGKVIAFALQGTNAVYCFRRDFGRLNAPLKDADYLTGKDYSGHDMTAFRVSWWAQHRATMPDMLIGREAWDPCIRILIDETNRGSDNCLRDLIGHERHDSFWERAENRYRLPGQMHNLTLAAKFMRARRIDPRKYGIIL